jgi:hypothetical protein
LFFRDDEREDRLESHCNDLGDDFVDYVTKRDCPKVLQIGDSFLLGDQGEKSGI